MIDVQARHLQHPALRQLKILHAHVARLLLLHISRGHADFRQGSDGVGGGRGRPPLQRRKQLVQQLIESAAAAAGPATEASCTSLAGHYLLHGLLHNLLQQPGREPKPLHVRRHAELKGRARPLTPALVVVIIIVKRDTAGPNRESERERSRIRGQGG